VLFYLDVHIRPGMTFCNFKSREWENISVLKATKQDICRINWIKKNKTYQYKYV
jgi:hypothetical protein